jgi:hypothetical protein
MEFMVHGSGWREGCGFGAILDTTKMWSSFASVAADPFN